MPHLSDRPAAMKAPHEHTLVKGVGYVKLRPAAEMPKGRPPCLPPPGARTKSRHRLVNERGGTAMEFVWNAELKVWTRPGGNRLGWRADYLGAHGWSYVGAVS